MRSPFPLALSFATLVAVAACSPTAEESPQQPAGVTAEEGEGMRADQVSTIPTIEIGLDGSGAIIVSVDALTVERGQSPVVSWSSDDSMQDRNWIVGFGGQSPFRNQRSVFTSDPGRDRAPISSTAGIGEYKYWIWVSDDNGEWISLDPKIVIIDDPGADSIGGGNGGG